MKWNEDIVKEKKICVIEIVVQFDIEFGRDSRE